jgi:nucleoside 2-deoxyribosyltransferase
MHCDYDADDQAKGHGGAVPRQIDNRLVLVDSASPEVVRSYYCTVYSTGIPMSLKIYLAGPDVFLADTRSVGLRKQDICREFGFQGLFPLDNDEGAAADHVKIFQANCSLMRQADIGLCNLTPFRGPSADAGTVFELGFLFALGKPIFGYTSSATDYVQRVPVALSPAGEQNVQPRDYDGYAVENFELSDNLMIVQAIRDSGGTIVYAEEKIGGSDCAPLAAFEAFRICLRIVSERYSQGIDKERQCDGP